MYWHVATVANVLRSHKVASVANRKFVYEDVRWSRPGHFKQATDSTFVHVLESASGKPNAGAPSGLFEIDREAKRRSFVQGRKLPADVHHRRHLHHLPNQVFRHLEVAP